MIAATLIAKILVGLFWILFGSVLGELLYRVFRLVRACFVPTKRLVDDEN